MLKGAEAVDDRNAGLIDEPQPGLGLGTFIGEDATVRLQVDWPSVAAVVGAVVVVVGAAIALSVWVVGRLELGRVMRIGEE